MILSLIFLTLGAAAPADTLPVQEPTRWSAEWRFAHAISDPGIREGLHTLRFTRRIGRSQVAGEALRLAEGGRRVHGGGFDLHTPLWRGAEGMIHLSAAPEATTLPRLTAGGDLTLHVAGSWEISGGGAWREYEHAKLILSRLGVARSAGGWRLQAGAGVAGNRGDELAPAGFASLRRQVGAGGSHLEIHAARGREILDYRTVPSGTEALLQEAWSIGGGARVRVGRHLALLGNGRYHDYGTFGRRSEVETAVQLLW